MMIKRKAYKQGGIIQGVEIKILKEKCSKGCGREFHSLYPDQLKQNKAAHEQFCKGKNKNK